MIKKTSFVITLLLLMILQTFTTSAYGTQYSSSSTLEYKRFNPNFKAYQYIETDKTSEYKYYEFNNHIYKLIDSDDWFTAKNTAENNGGYLASITSDEENNFIYNLLINENIYNAYFGAEDNDHDGIWEWSNGEGIICTVDDYNIDDSYGYCNWSDGEPNSELSLNGTYESVGMFYFKYSYTWNDGVNYDSGTFITESENIQVDDLANTLHIQVKQPFYDGFILVENSQVSLVDEFGNTLQTTTTDCYGYAYFEVSNIDISKCSIYATYNSDFSNNIPKYNESWYCKQKELYNQFQDDCRVVTIASGEASATEKTLLLDNISYKVNLSVAFDSSTTIAQVQEFMDNLSTQVELKSNGKYSIGEIIYLQSEDSLNYHFITELTATLFDMCDIKISSLCQTGYYGNFNNNQPIQSNDSMIYQGLFINPTDFQTFTLDDSFFN